MTSVLFSTCQLHAVLPDLLNYMLCLPHGCSDRYHIISAFNRIDLQILFEHALDFCLTSILLLDYIYFLPQITDIDAQRCRKGRLNYLGVISFALIAVPMTFIVVNDLVGKDRKSVV